MQAPNPFALASPLTRVCLVVSKRLFSIIWCIFDLMLLNAELCSAFQSKLLFLASGFFFNSGRSGSESFARFVINFVRWWTLPRNDRNCFNGFGLSSLVIASVLVISGVIPLGVIVKPSHSMIFFANSIFCRLMASPSMSNLFRILCNSFHVLEWIPWWLLGYHQGMRIWNVFLLVFYRSFFEMWLTYQLDRRNHLGIYTCRLLFPRVC